MDWLYRIVVSNRPNLPLYSVDVSNTLISLNGVQYRQTSLTDTLLTCVAAANVEFLTVTDPSGIFLAPTLHRKPKYIFIHYTSPHYMTITLLPKRKMAPEKMDAFLTEKEKPREKTSPDVKELMELARDNPDLLTLGARVYGVPEVTRTPDLPLRS